MTDHPCATAILALLNLYPDCEMRLSDVWGELDQQFEQSLLESTLEDLFAARRLMRITDAGVRWYSASLETIPDKDWGPEGN